MHTHSSFVFIASPFVYKVKKPVNFGFLDFSTLEKRRHFCESEVTLKIDFAPEFTPGSCPSQPVVGASLSGREKVWWNTRSKCSNSPMGISSTNGSDTVACRPLI